MYSRRGDDAAGETAYAGDRLWQCITSVLQPVLISNQYRYGCEATRAATYQLQRARNARLASTTMSGLPLRHRGAHVSDLLRQLEAVGGGVRADTFRQSLVARHHAQQTDEGDHGFAAVFANLAVWIDATIKGSEFHSGTAKVQLYVGFLRVLVDELLPDERLRGCVQSIDEYVGYLLNTGNLSEDEAKDKARLPLCSPVLRSPVSVKRSRNAKVTVSYLPVKIVSAPRHQPMAAQLSPRILQQLRREEPISKVNSNADSSGRLNALIPTHPQWMSSRTNAAPITPKAKTLIELSAHEEAILELALYFGKSVEQLIADQRQKQYQNLDRSRKVPAPSRSSNENDRLSMQWSHLDGDQRKAALTRVKRKLSKQQFFSTTDSGETHAHVYGSSAATRTVVGMHQIQTAGEDSSRITARRLYSLEKIESTQYLSLIILCLNETVRQTNVFTQELAQFAWLQLCEIPIEEFDHTLTEVEKQRRSAQVELLRLRDAKLEIQTTIRDCETRIEQLQTRNMSSVRLWELEQQEADHIAQEERWHGHCKALMLRSLSRLAESSNVSAWCEMKNESTTTSHDEPEKIATGVNEMSTYRDDGSSSLAQRYELLAPGAALLDGSLRHHLVYLSHLLVLCRSYLHLDEHREARDVLESTTINLAMERSNNEDGSSTAKSASPSITGVEQHSPLQSPASASHLIAQISQHELETLRELSEALRAIEVVYAETTGERPLGKRGIVTTIAKQASPYRRRDAYTQFPESLAHDGLTNARTFLRSLAYCTIAATSFAGSQSFVSSSFAVHADHHEITSYPDSSSAGVTIGSGRRRGSAMFKAQRPALDTNGEHQPQSQMVMIRLDRAVHKLPKHFKLLLLQYPPVSQRPRQPSTPSLSTVAALSQDELVVRIQIIYERLAQYIGETSSVSTSASWSLAQSSQHHVPQLGVSLASVLPGSDSISAATIHQAEPECCDSMRSPESIVRAIYALTLDATDGDVGVAECEFVRLFSSIQVVLSKTSASVPTPVAGASLGQHVLAAAACHEVIYFFAILTKLYYLPRPTHQAMSIPRRLFAVVSHCQRLLALVAIEKKKLHIAGGGGSSFDIWVAASQAASPTSSNGFGASNTVLFNAPSSTDNHSSSIPPTPTSPRANKAPTTFSIYPSQPFVLLESAKLLLVYVAGLATHQPSAPAISLDDSAKLLDQHAIPATVSLLQATTPGPYNILSAGNNPSHQQPNGVLTDSMIVPLQVAVAVIARAWLERVGELEQPLNVAFRSALSDIHPSSTFEDDARLSFREFVHVMTNGQPQALPLRTPAASSASWESGMRTVIGALTYTQLAELYASAAKLDKVQHIQHCNLHGTSNSKHLLLIGVKSTTLISVVADKLDLTETLDRLVHADMKSIEHAVLGLAARTSSNRVVAASLQDMSALVLSMRHPILLNWLIRPPYTPTGPSGEVGDVSTAGTVLALQKSWTAHHGGMEERLCTAAQADGSAIEGVLIWLIGRRRYRQAEHLLYPQSRSVNHLRISESRRAAEVSTERSEASSTLTGLQTIETEKSSSVISQKDSHSFESHEEISHEQLGVMWASYYYLQLELSRAGHLLDAVPRPNNKGNHLPARTQKTSAKDASHEHGIYSTTAAVAPSGTKCSN